MHFNNFYLCLCGIYTLKSWNSRVTMKKKIKIKKIRYFKKMKFKIFGKLNFNLFKSSYGHPRKNLLYKHEIIYIFIECNDTIMKFWIARLLLYSTSQFHNTILTTPRSNFLYVNNFQSHKILSLCSLSILAHKKYFLSRGNYLQIYCEG